MACSRRHSNNSFTTLCTGSPSNEIDLAANAAELFIANHFSIDLPHQIDLHSRVDRDDIVNFSYNKGIIGVIDTFH